MESPIKGGGTKSDAMDDGTTSGSSGIVTYTSPPALVTPNNSAYARLHVCQASYGDCLALEIDPTPPNNYPTFPPVGWSGNPWSYGDGELQFGISPAEALKGQRQVLRLA